MPLEFLLDRFDELPATGALLEGLPVAGHRLPLAGLPGSAPALLVAGLARRLPQRLFAVVTATPADAARGRAVLGQRVGDVAVVYPRRDGLGREGPAVETAGERSAT